jgi:hypothetical protein
MFEGEGIGGARAFVGNPLEFRKMRFSHGQSSELVLAQRIQARCSLVFCVTYLSHQRPLSNGQAFLGSGLPRRNSAGFAFRVNDTAFDRGQSPTHPNPFCPRYP